VTELRETKPEHRTRVTQDGSNGPVGSHLTTDDGTCIYFERFSPGGGSGRRRGPRSKDAPPGLLIMGLGANGRLWAPAVKRMLASGYDVIVVDNRGCGRSSTPWRPWTTRTMARDAVAVLDELGVAQAHVNGVSLGGMIAQEIALEFPERVSTLVLGCTTGGLPRLNLAPRRGLLHIFESQIRSLRPGSDPERQVRDFLRMLGPEDFVAQCQPGEEHWETVVAMLEDPASQRGLALQLLACIRHSSWSRLHRLSMPVQVHHGTADSLVPFAAGQELARRIPGAQFVVHEGAGHTFGLERPEKTSERIVEFLAEAEAR